MIIGLFTQLKGSGGIQRVGRHLSEAISEMSSDQHVPYAILSLADERGWHELTANGQHVIFRGFGHDYISFLAATTARMRDASVALVGHVQLLPVAITARMKRSHPKLAVVAHGVEVWSRSALVARNSLPLADRIIAVSEFTSNRITRLHRVARSRIKVVHPGLDPSLAGSGEISWGLASSGKVLLTVARLSRRDRYKGVEHVIKALPEVVRLVPGTRYVIAGGGSDSARIRTLADDIGVGPLVEIRQRLTDSALSETYRESEVFVMPSLKEGFGLVFLEAMAHGKPVIAGNHGGTPELVVDGETGFLVTYGDTLELSQRVIQLLE